MFEDAKDRIHAWKYKLSTKISPPDQEFHDDYSEASVEDPKNPEPPKDSTLGADLSVKTYYEGKNSSNGFYEWVDVPPRQVSEKVARKNDRIAIKIYKVIDKEKESVNGRYTLKFHMIDLQNPALIEALKPILEKENVHLDVSEICKFKAPFRPLWFCYDEIRELHKTSDEGSALKQHVGLLLRVMGEIFNGVKTRLRSLEDASLISFNLSWAFYPRGTVVYYPGQDCERVLKVETGGYSEKDGVRYFLLDCKEIVFDGEGFVWQDHQLRQPAFTGNMPIKEMRHYPLKFHEDNAAIKTKMSDRGIKVLDFQGLSYCDYTGLGIFEEGDEREKHNVDGRILIDSYGYSKHHLGLTRRSNLKDKVSQKHKITGLSVTSPNSKRKGCMISSSQAPTYHIDDSGNSYYIDDVGAIHSVDMTITNDKFDKDDMDDSYIKRLTQAEQVSNKKEMMDRPDDLMFLSPMLQGYALKNKTWLSFYVGDVRPMFWNDTAYDHLVYPESQKDLVLSFVENHRKSPANAVMDDVIKGKGQGLIFLLSGPPGTGKTLTAEAVADKTRRPLFYLQAEDLGIAAASLGANLKRCFEMATDWNAVVLLDEADVFMAERNPNDIARNELVSIFLREIEYFRGVLFLTTNLYDTIDSAFRSRVNIHLLFNPLTPSARQILWRKFLERIPGPKVLADDGSDHRPLTPYPSDDSDASHQTIPPARGAVTEDDLKELAKYNLNGREIKNAVNTVKNYCDVKGHQITLGQLENAIRVTAPQAGRVGSVGSQDELYR